MCIAALDSYEIDLHHNKILPEKLEKHEKEVARHQEWRHDLEKERVARGGQVCLPLCSSANRGEMWHTHVWQAASGPIGCKCTKVSVSESSSSSFPRSVSGSLSPADGIVCSFTAQVAIDLLVSTRAMKA